MSIIRSIRGAMKFDKIKGHFTSGNYKGLFRVKTFILNIESNLHYENDCIVKYFPFICVVTSEAATEMISFGYGANTLGNCTYYHFNKVKGDLVPSISLEFVNCIARYVGEIDKETLKKIKPSKMLDKLELDEGYSMPTNFANYIEKVKYRKDLDSRHNGFHTDSSRYILMVIYYTAITLECKSLSIKGVLEGSVATRIDCNER